MAVDRSRVPRANLGASIILAGVQILAVSAISREDVLFFPNSIPLTYHEIEEELQFNSQALPLPSEKLALQSFTPFCQGYERPEPEADVEPECVRWEVSTQNSLRCSKGSSKVPRRQAANLSAYISFLAYRDTRRLTANTD